LAHIGPAEELCLQYDNGIIPKYYRNYSDYDHISEIGGIARSAVRPQTSQSSV
jgi:hypothetical protein